jgi:putative copper export protein
MLGATRRTLFLLALASLGILVSRTLELNGGDWNTLPADMRIALAVTHFGHVWAWRVPALAGAWLASAWPSRRQPRWRIPIMLCAVAAIALTRSETGHPADAGDFTMGVWIDWLHLLAAGAWVGSLFGMTLVVFPHLLERDQRSTPQAAVMFGRLSSLSGIALGVLLACGLYSAAGQLGRLNALWTTRFGITLDVKLTLVLAMVAVGAHNRYVKLPALLACAGLPGRRSPVLQRMPGHAVCGPTPSTRQVLRDCARAVLVESVLGLAVIVTTGVLLHAMPPAAMPSAPAMEVRTPTGAVGQ